MTDPNPPSPSGGATDPELECLMEEFVERRRRGENPSISEYASKHPCLADRIRELFPAAVFLENLETPHPAG